MTFRARFRRSAAAVCALGLLLPLSACGPRDEPDVGADSCASALLVDGTSKENINVGVLDGQDGWWLEENGTESGFDYDLANWIGRELCFEQVPVHLTVEERIPDLVNGQVDLVIATFSMTDTRMADISFVGPYIINSQGILVRSDDTEITRVRDLSGATVCAERGSTSLDQLADELGSVITRREENTLGACRDLLKSGQVDAISTDQLVLYGMTLDDPELKVVPDATFGLQERYGIGIAHDRYDWCLELQDALKDFMIDGRWDSAFATNLPDVQRPTLHRPDPNNLDTCRTHEEELEAAEG